MRSKTLPKAVLYYSLRRFIVLCGSFWWVVVLNKPYKIEIENFTFLYARQKQFYVKGLGGEGLEGLRNDIKPNEINGPMLFMDGPYVNYKNNTYLAWLTGSYTILSG